MEDKNFLDPILVEIGEFGLYQKRMFCLILIVTTMSCFGIVTYLFEVKQVNHRCKIPECESNVTEIEPPWWKYAIPADNGKPSKCSRFRRLNNDISCNASDFDQKIEEPCENFVYETQEISILHDFNLQCKENVWQLTLVGTINSIGLFIGMPISGIISDRFGRKTGIVGAMVLSGILGIARSFSNSYIMFAVLELLDSICRAGAYLICYILAVELVGPKKRALLTLILSVAYAGGGILEGLIAWALQSWRELLRVLYFTFVTVFIYYWLIPESVRWLLINNRFSELQNILKNVAKTNGKTISEESLKKIEEYISNKKDTKNTSIKPLFASTLIILRLINCSICWLLYIFLYYGLTINSVELSNNSYLNFILTFVAEIPGAIVAFFIMDRLGRKLTLVCGFLVSALSSAVLIFVPKDLVWLETLLYLLGKFGVSVNVPLMNTFTIELFPTPFRNSLLATCSMFGRFGAMMAPQLPLLDTVWKLLSLILLTCAGLLAALLILLFPETRNAKLPDTIEEALNIGKHHNKT